MAEEQERWDKSMLVLKSEKEDIQYCRCRDLLLLVMGNDNFAPRRGGGYMRLGVFLHVFNHFSFS